MSIIIVAACAYYLFVRIFRRKESRKAHYKLYHLQPRQEAKARRLARAVSNGASGNTTNSDHSYDYRGLPRTRRRNFDIDLMSSIWEDAE